MKQTNPESRIEVWHSDYINEEIDRWQKDKNSRIIQIEPVGKAGEYIVEVVDNAHLGIPQKTCNHDLQELRYYYDDDWGHKGTQVWDDKTGKELILYYCRNCGQVFAKKDGEPPEDRHTCGINGAPCCGCRPVCGAKVTTEEGEK